MNPPNSLFCFTAIAMACKGWRVFPVRPKQKRPKINEWQVQATTDPAIIQRWWTQWPTANVGIATGEGSNLVVLDVDVRDGKSGDDSLAQLAGQWGKLPTTVKVLTSTGGKHVYFTYPNNAEIRNS